MRERRQGFPFKHVERYTFKKPTSEAGRLSAHLPQRLAEQQPHDGGLNKPKHEPPKLTPTSPKDEQPQRMDKINTQRFIEFNEEQAKKLLANPWPAELFTVEELEVDAELQDLRREEYRIAAELVKPDVERVLYDFFTRKHRKRGEQPKILPSIETIEDELERPRLEAELGAVSQQIEDKLRAAGKLPATGPTGWYYLDAAADGKTYLVRSKEIPEGTRAEAKKFPFGKDHPDIQE
jgi:hypothetical protein